MEFYAIVTIWERTVAVVGRTIGQSVVKFKAKEQINEKRQRKTWLLSVYRIMRKKLENFYQKARGITIVVGLVINLHCS